MDFIFLLFNEDTGLKNQKKTIDPCIVLKFQIMPRSVNAVASRRRRKKILKAARGYFGARSKVYTVAKNAVEKAMQYSYIGRKLKKRAFRRLWIARINAAARQEGMSYSTFMHGLSKADIKLNRKVLADLAMNHSESFKTLVNQVK